MEITGYEIISRDYTGDVLGQKRVLKLTPDDLKSQLKHTKEVRAGSKVWIEAEVRKTMDFGVWVRISDKQGDCEHFVSTESIIAAFPAEQEKEKAELTGKDCTSAAQIAGIFNEILKTLKDLQETVANIHCHQ